MGILISKIVCGELDRDRPNWYFPECDYCNSYPTDEIPVLLVYHRGKLGGRYICYNCLLNRRS